MLSVQFLLTLWLSPPLALIALAIILVGWLVLDALERAAEPSGMALVKQFGRDRKLRLSTPCRS